MELRALLCDLLIIWVLLLLLLPEKSESTTTDKYFALCLIVKATREYELFDIREFVDYHLKIGTSVIYMFDDNSPTPFNITLLDHIRTGAVHYTFIG